MMPTPWLRSVADHPEQAVDLAVAERRRGLVHDHDARVGAERAGDLDELLLGHGERARRTRSGSIVAPTRSSSSRARAARGSNRPGARRRRVRAPARCSRPRSGRGRAPAAGRWRRCPSDRATRGSLWVTRWPRDPDRRPSGGDAPVTILMSVDLPAPFSPTSACTSPARRSNETSRNACTPENDLLIPRSVE